MTTTTPTRPRHLVFGHLVRGQLVGLEVLLGWFVLAVAAFGLVVHLITGLERGIWGGATLLIRWFAVGMGVYLTAVYLPMYVAHGRTRREVAVGGAGFSVLLAGWLGVAVLVGFAIEAGVYHLLGWSELLSGAHPLSSAAQAARTLVEHSVTFLVLITLGALGGAAFYRDGRLGVAVLPLGVAMLAVSQMLLSDEAVELIAFVLTDPGLPSVLLIDLACVAIAGALTWRIVRDLPLRNRNT